MNIITGEGPEPGTTLTQVGEAAVLVDHNARTVTLSWDWRGDLVDHAKAVEAHLSELGPIQWAPPATLVDGIYHVNGTY